MTNIFFKPYVGKDYQNCGIINKRVMVLGESHYCDGGCECCGDCSHPCECNLFTQNVVRDYLDSAKKEAWMTTYLKFERSLLEREQKSLGLSDERVKELISSVLS